MMTNDKTARVEQRALLPCPFCNDAESLSINSEDLNGWKAQVYCSNCDALGGWGSYHSDREDAEEEAIAIWRRPARVDNERYSEAGCSMGVGCDEAGVCYADAHGEPDRCPKAALSEAPAGASDQGGGDLASYLAARGARPLNEAERAALEALHRDMVDNVIPAITGSDQAPTVAGDEREALLNEVAEIERRKKAEFEEAGRKVFGPYFGAKHVRPYSDD